MSSEKSLIYRLSYPKLKLACIKSNDRTYFPRFVVIFISKKPRKLLSQPGEYKIKNSTNFEIPDSPPHF